jgi:recombination protein RecT
MGTDSTAIVQERATMFGDLLQKHQKQLAAALPRHIPAERFARIVLTTLRRNPRLMECSAQSVFGSIMQSAQDGLELDGTHAALVPYKDHGRLEAHYQPMFRGMLALARRSGDVSSFRARAVYEGDVFDYEEGLSPKLRHVPMGCEDPAKITHFYAIADLRGGGQQFEVMSRAQVNAIRDNSPGYRYDPKGSPWGTHYPEMGCKTVARRALKWCPTSAEVQRSITRDEAGDRGEGNVDYDLPSLEIPTDPGSPEPEQPKQPDRAAGFADRLRDASGKRRGGTVITKPGPNDKAGPVEPHDGPPPAGNENGEVPGA